MVAAGSGDLFSSRSGCDLGARVGAVSNHMGLTLSLDTSIKRCSVGWGTDSWHVADPGSHPESAHDPPHTAGVTLLTQKKAICCHWYNDAW